MAGEDLDRIELVRIFSGAAAVDAVRAVVLSTSSGLEAAAALVVREELADRGVEKARIFLERIERRKIEQRERKEVEKRQA